MQEYNKLPKDETKERIDKLLKKLEESVELNNREANLSNVCTLLTQLSYIQLTILKELTDIREQMTYLKGYDEWFNYIHTKISEILAIKEKT